MKNFTDTPFFEGQTNNKDIEEINKKQELIQNINSSNSYSDGDFFNFVVVSGKLYKILTSNIVDTAEGTKLKCVNVVMRTRQNSTVKNDTFIKLTFFGASGDTVEKKFIFDKEIIINGYFKAMNFSSRSFTIENKENTPIEFVVKQIVKI